MSFFGSTDYYTEVAKGNIDGHTVDFMQGRNPLVTLSTPENLWDLGGILTEPTVGEQLQVRSLSANDAAAGTGARTVDLQYLDDNYILQNELFTLNGTTPVISVATNILAFRKAKVKSAGSFPLQNDGDIIFETVGGATSRGGILEGANKSLHGFYTVEAGKQAYIVYGYSTINKGKDAKIAVFTTDGPDGLYFEQTPSEIYQNSIEVNPKAPIGPIAEKSSFKFLCTTENQNTSVNASLQILLVDIV